MAAASSPSPCRVLSESLDNSGLSFLSPSNVIIPVLFTQLDYFEDHMKIRTVKIFKYIASCTNI